MFLKVFRKVKFRDRENFCEKKETLRHKTYALALDLSLLFDYMQIAQTILLRP